MATATVVPDPHAALRDDVRLLGTLLGETLRAREGEELFVEIERVRALAKAAHEGDRGDFGRLADRLRDLPLESAVPIARAFSHFLALANIAEQHHRVRRRREYARAAERRPQPGSCDEAFPRLLATGVERQALADAVGALRIELVLTAHPTEIARRTVLQAQRRVADLLALRDHSDLTAVERDDAVEALRREIAILWETEEGRDRAVSPLDEVRAGLVAFEQTLWDAVPRYLRSVDRALRASVGRSLPLDATPIRFGSWIGGDRDGNPNVTTEITRQATWLARWMAAYLFAHDVEALRTELSLSTASDELKARVDGAAEPYRALVREVALRLAATREWAQRQLTALENASLGRSAVAPRDDRRSANEPEAMPYIEATEFVDALQLCHRSLVETGNELIAAGRLTDILRRAAV